MRPLLLMAALVLAWRAMSIGAQAGAPTGEWRVHTGAPHANRYSPLSQISAENIHRLDVAWRWPLADRALMATNPKFRYGRVQETPVMANGVLYTITPLGLVAALDPGTGQTRWVYDPESYSSGRPVGVGFVQRGLAYWTDDRSERILVGALDGYLLSIDAKTGKPDPTFGTNGKVDLYTGIRAANRPTNISTRAPLVAGDVVVMGSVIADAFNHRELPPGDVQAFDVRTGRKVWTFHTVPHKGEFGYDTWLDGSAEYSGSTNVWASMAYDPDLGYVYLPTSTPTNDYYGGHRLGDNLFAESIVCLHAKTGRRIWHFQAVHHGLWDYDFPAAPVLGDVTVDGRRVKAIMQVSKQGFVYALDRATGKPLWPIVERPVPPSKLPGERASRTQPFPAKPRAYDLQGSTEENVMSFTPDLRRRALEKLRKWVHGPLFTPPSLEGTISVPGNWGAASWGGASFDPETGMLYVPSRTLSHLQRLVPGAPGDTVNYKLEAGAPPPAEGQPSGDEAHAAVDDEPLSVEGLSLFKPPYSRVTAINMNTGEHVWMTPVGNGPREHPLLKGLNLPPLGDGIRGLPLLTKTLLFVSVTRLGINGSVNPPDTGFSTKYLEPNASRKLLYVFDKKSGRVLREVELDGGTASVPMTYLHNGKQYIVMAVGAGDRAELVALSVNDNSTTVNSSASSASAAGTPRVKSTTNASMRVYTEQQAARGRASYQTECAACHGRNLQGEGFAPPLRGEAFDTRWKGDSVANLLATIRATMPQGRPSALAGEVYADIVAHILQVNGYPAGDRELGVESASLQQFKFDR